MDVYSGYLEDFDKIYYFRSKPSYCLPDSVFESPKWVIPPFQEKKKELNSVKALTGKYNLTEWSKHTANRYRAGFVMKKLNEKVKPELLTQAWCKFYEILGTFPVIPICAINDQVLKSLHLCEAPGAFISALNQYLFVNFRGLEWKWNASTLNPNYEGNDMKHMINDDRLIRHTFNKWIFGEDFTGDLTEYHNFEYLVNLKKRSDISLVTADGSIDCMSNPGEQERLVERLHFCETLAALAVLQPGGAFVLKIFTIFEESTICLLFLLHGVFETMSVFKPFCSKSGNSEVYVICTSYTGFFTLERLWDQLINAFKDVSIFNSRSMFHLTEIHPAFLNQVGECSEYFMNKQINAIRNNINTFEQQKRSDNIYNIKSHLAKVYLSKFDIRPMPDEFRIVPNLQISDTWRIRSVKKLKSFYDIKMYITIKKPHSLDIVTGKHIVTVKNSKFVDLEKLEKVPNLFINNKNTPKLYNSIVSMLENNIIVINVNEFSFDTFSNFQRQIFQRVYSILEERKNIMFIRIPFITHALIGLLYITGALYEKVYINSDCIFLNNFTTDISEQSFFTNMFVELNDAYENIAESESLFIKDIVQILSPELFENSCFLEHIWNYNNQLLSDNKCFIKP